MNNRAGCHVSPGPVMRCWHGRFGLRRGRSVSHEDRPRRNSRRAAVEPRPFPLDSEAVGRWLQGRRAVPAGGAAASVDDRRAPRAGNVARADGRRRAARRAGARRGPRRSFCCTTAAPAPTRTSASAATGRMRAQLKRSHRGRAVRPTATGSRSPGCRFALARCTSPSAAATLLLGVRPLHRDLPRTPPRLSFRGRLPTTRRTSTAATSSTAPAAPAGRRGRHRDVDLCTPAARELVAECTTRGFAYMQTPTMTSGLGTADQRAAAGSTWSVASAYRVDDG